MQRSISTKFLCICVVKIQRPAGRNNHRQTNHKHQQVRNRHGVQHSIQPKPQGKQQRKSHAKQHLPHHGNGGGGKRSAQGLQIDEGALVHRGQRHHAEIDPEAFHRIVRIVRALVGCAKNSNELPGKQFHDQQRHSPGNGLCRQQACEQRLGPVSAACPDVIAYHWDAASRQSHRNGNDDLEELHHNAQHRHGNLCVLRLSKDRVNGAVFQGHVLNRRHCHDQGDLRQKAANSQGQIFLCQ